MTEILRQVFLNWLINKLQRFVRFREDLLLYRIFVYECYRATGAISYLINRKCAEFLVKNNTPIRFQSDAWSIYAPSKLINLYALNEDLCSEWNGPNGIYKSTVGISAKRACHSSKHKKLKNQFLKEHGYTKFNWICDSIKSYYYSLKRKL